MGTIDLSALFEAITAAGTLAVPVVVAVLAARFNNQLKKWEANQWRNQELIRARLEYYRLVVPRLNDLMCYFTFVGTWKRFTPVDVINMKRDLDREFYCAVPLFSAELGTAYRSFMDKCFSPFNAWPLDARLRTAFIRRREAAGDAWDPTWEPMFLYDAGRGVSEEELTAIRKSYDAVIAHFASDIELTASRDRYVTTDVSANAH